MAAQRLIVAIGRVERALSRLERLQERLVPTADNEVAARHEKLKAETRVAIKAIDDILGGSA